MRWFFAATLSCLIFAATVSSTFVPLRDANGIDYLLAWPGSRTLAVVSSIVVLSLLFIYLAVITAARAVPEAVSQQARAGRWLAPLTGLGLIIIGMLPAIPGVAEHAAPLAYFFYDLRWWWLAFLALWTLVNAERLIGSPAERWMTAFRTWSPATRLLSMDSAIFAGLIVWVVATTPNLRFVGALHGDEPKYIRYCELWYQGGGLDISSKRLFADEPLDSQPLLLRTAAQLPRAIVEEAGALAADLRGFASHPTTFRWNRVTGRNGFVLGKRGGIYEIYQPGVSLVLFPGYFIDRYLLGIRPGYQGEFPEELVMTNLTMLFVYGFCGVALFRVFRHLLSSDGLAMLWGAIGMAILPMSAFAFQFYPELVALLILLLLTNFFLVHASAARPAVCAAAGFAAGALCWLHPRFLLLSLFLAGVGLLRTRTGSWRAFSAGYALVLLSVMGFDYRVTGSWLPTARWDAVNTGGTLNPLAVPLNLLGYLFHRTWGLLPPALILMAVTPGLVILARRHAAIVGALIVIGLCLGVPAAGHTLTAAAGTPGRLVLAVVPLFIWPVAVVVRRFWTSTAVRSATAAAVILSLDAAWSYNWTHKKHLGPMHDVAMSGWKPNLMFPDIYVLPSEWSRSSAVVTLALIALITILSIVALRRDRADSPVTVAPRPAWLTSAAVIGAMIATATLLTGMIGRWYYADYLIDDRDAHRVAARALVGLDRCRVCFTSRQGSIDWTSLNPNRADAMAVDLTSDRRRVGVRVSLVADDDPEPRFGRIHVDFGDGGSAPWTGIVDQGRYEHEYAKPGTYSVVTWLQLRDGRTRRDRRTITISDPQSGG